MLIEQSAYIGQQSTVNSQPFFPVMEAFYTLQGEGFHQGKAAYFIRLAGCDVGCFWCDVKESWDESAHPIKTIEQIIEEARLEIGQPSTVNRQPMTNDRQSAIVNRQSSMVEGRLSTVVSQQLTVNGQPSTTNSQPIFVITGGEPLLHNLDELTNQLQAENYKTHIETSGSSPLSGFWDWICLSPKKFKKPLPEAFAVANELKVVIYNKSDFKWAEENAAQVSTKCKLYLQPEWSRSARVIPLIINFIKANPKWQLSMQVHKYINIP